MATPPSIAAPPGQDLTARLARSRAHSRALALDRLLWFIGGLLLPTFVLITLWLGRPKDAAQLAGMAAITGGMLVCRRLGFGAAPAAHVVVGCATVFCGPWLILSGLGDVGTLFFLSLAPSLALVLLGPRYALAWAGVAIVATLGALGLQVAMGWPGVSTEDVAGMRVAQVSALGLVHLGVLYQMRLEHLLVRSALDEVLPSLRKMRSVLQGAERAAQEASRHRTEFLQVMSHELRTPLNGVIGVAELLSLSELDENQQHLVGTLQRSAASFLDVLTDEMDVSRIERGEVSAVLGTVPVFELVSTLVDLLRPGAMARRVNLYARFGVGVPSHVRGDAAGLRKVLSHLLSNALDHTAQGNVVLSVTVEPAEVEPEDALRLHLSVSDEGSGMSEAELEMALTGKHPGMGFRAALVTAKRMSGELTGRSVVGRGTTITLAVPVEAVVPEDAPPPEDEEEAPTLRVLLVEDNPVNRLVVRRMVESLGHEVGEAHDGQQAVDAVIDAPWDVILMDCEMPVMDGLEATRQIRKSHPVLPIVALTAHAIPEVREQAFDAGMSDWLTKPVRREQLQQAFERHSQAAVLA